MSERIPLSKKLRFEIFKRDGFACQYCGAKAPTVVLECDHIVPVAEGGTNDPLNLVTSCAGCNSGKGARLLSDHQVIEKQRAQLEELNERRVQLEMLAEWQQELSALAVDEADYFERIWRDITGSDTRLTDRGRDHIKKWRKKFSPEEIARAMRGSADSYLVRNADGTLDLESLEKAFSYVPRVASVTRAEADRPHLKRLFYIRGILRNRLTYLRDQDALDLMEEAAQVGVDIDSLELFAKRARTWSAFRRGVEQFIEEQSNG